MGINRIATLWGFAESTIFVIVPDVWLSLAGRKKLLVGLIACLYSLGGALLGGLLMYFWGQQDTGNALNVIESIPAINSDMITHANASLSQQGIYAILLGPLIGTPYKVYAVQAATSGISPGLFMLISVPARLIRFILITTICHFGLKLFINENNDTLARNILLSGWGLFYLGYFLVMSG